MSRHGRPLQGRFLRQPSRETELAATAAGTASHRCFSMSGSAWLCAFRSFSFFPIFLRPRRLHFDFISAPPISGRSWQPPSHRVVSSFLEQYIPTYTVRIIALPRNRFKIFSLGSVSIKSCTLMSPTKTELVHKTGAVKTPRKKKVRVQK